MLKTNYTDSVAPDGVRTYRISPQNAPQDAFACAIVDETQYLRNGDRFGAADINATNAEVNGKAPILHAAADGTYGLASATKFGHTGLSDAIDAGNADANSGYAATPRAVALVNAKVGTAQASANTAQGTADAALPKSGGTMTDWIHWNKQTKGLQWVTDDGTIFQLRPYSVGNSYQFVTQKPNGEVLASWNVDNQGLMQVNGFHPWQLQCLDPAGGAYQFYMRSKYNQHDDGKFYLSCTDTATSTDNYGVHVDVANEATVVCKKVACGSNGAVNYPSGWTAYNSTIASAYVGEFIQYPFTSIFANGIGTLVTCYTKILSGTVERANATHVVLQRFA